MREELIMLTAAELDVTRSPGSLTRLTAASNVRRRTSTTPTPPRFQHRRALAADLKGR